MKMIENRVEVLVLELTNRCDLNCIFCARKRKNDFINLRILERFLEENHRLVNSIRTFELGWGGNPLLHKDIKKVIKLFKSYGISLNIVTNGFNLVNILKNFSDKLLSGIHFTIFLDSSNENKNDLLMGRKGIFRKTLAAINYLKSRNLGYDILMRLTSKNYDDIESMIDFCKINDSNVLIPIEIFPPLRNRKLLLDDKTKSKVMSIIDDLMSRGENVHKVVHFAEPSGNCTYLRYKRLFINSKGNLGFCHFLTHLSSNEITDCRKYNFTQILQINNVIRKKFVEKKERQIENWKYPRENVSPCSYCMQQFGVKCKW